MPEPTWFILGAGRVGRTLARVLEAAGLLAGIWTRGSATAEEVSAFIDAPVFHGSLSELHPTTKTLLACVPDDATLRVLAALPEPVRAREDLVWLHTSGAKPGAELRKAGIVGPVGSCHPLQSISGAASDVEALDGAFFAVDGDPSALTSARELVALCGGVAGVVNAEARTAYHAAAVLASNGVYALLEAANQLAEAGGFSDVALTAGLARLARGSADSAVLHGVDAAATGPVVRGDAGTVSEHRRWLAERAPGLDELYVQLGERLVEIAERRGLDPRQLASLFSVLASRDQP